MMQELPWDLFWVIYNEPDKIFHKQFSKVEKGNTHIMKIFDKLDETIKLASELADVLIVVSDHGFSNYPFTLYINSLLYKLGLVKKSWKNAFGSLHEFLGENHKKVDFIKIPSWLYFIVSKKVIKSSIKRIYKLLTRRNLRATVNAFVDPYTSLAFTRSSTCYGIYVKKREIIEFLLSELKKYPFFEGVWRSEDVYHGPQVKRAPSIVISPKYDEGYIIGSPKITSKIVSEGTFYGHHPDGIFILYNKQNQSAKYLGKVDALDIAPTILSLLGLPLPIDIDGNVIQIAEFKPKRIKRYNYLKHWKLIKKIQTVKTKLAKTIKI